MHHYGNLPEAITDLRKKGYVLDFNPGFDCLVCTEHDFMLPPEEFVIDNAYRFEDDSDPENQSVLYAISSKDGLKGLLVNAYGIYADSMSNAMIEKLKVQHH